VGVNGIEYAVEIGRDNVNGTMNEIQIEEGFFDPICPKLAIYVMSDTLSECS
jgi:hypothetical protein